MWRDVDPSDDKAVEGCALHARATTVRQLHWTCEEAFLKCGKAMAAYNNSVQYLLTLPPRTAEEFEHLTGRRRPVWFACSDPPDQPLGSGAGTANLLEGAWRMTGGGAGFSDWLVGSRKLILHAGGQSRRLPAYAPTGKLLMPMPVFRWARGQRLDQSLLDLQLPDYERALAHAGPSIVALITSGDVIVQFGPELPTFPEVDVLGLGMCVPPEMAEHFGVFFVPHSRPSELAFFLQKPSAARIRKLAEDYIAWVDVGMWLLSARAIMVLMERCGWDAKRHAFTGGAPKPYELFAQFGLALGSKPVCPNASIGALTSAVALLPEPRFYHFGTNQQLIESVVALQNRAYDSETAAVAGARQQPDQVTQNSRFEAGLHREGNHSLWVENSVIPASWELAAEHILTGVPENDWRLHLEPGVCLDFVPVGDQAFAIRPYGFRDSFRGVLDDPGTRWFGRPASEWFATRGLRPEACGLQPQDDIQVCPLFPVLSPADLEGEFIAWLFEAKPSKKVEFAEKWRALRRLSARQLCEEINVRRLFAQRARLRDACLRPMLEHFRQSVFFRLDLDSTARAFAGTKEVLPHLELSEHDDPMHGVHEPMFRSAVLRFRGDPRWSDFEARAFGRLREILVEHAQLSPARPRRNVLEDQIVWARSPVRLDLAGGWTDTPPYCLEHGGKVLNVGVDLNGQPPIQAFAKLSPRPELVIRSIDLGVEERVRSYAELDTYAEPGSAFALAKAAFALAGFLPRFQPPGASFKSLEDLLREFGGGIELSLLSAVPKGSGLGTSSILAATVLAALADLCGLDWDRHVLFTRTLALEQLLTTGGGWQDQAGAIFRGIKLIETAPGLEQRPGVRWLPPHLFEREYANHTILLYYTGITRLAKNILAEIVRGIFLNHPAHLRTIAEIGRNADTGATAIQKCDYELLAKTIRTAWALNQQLDSGTNPPAVADILAQVADYLTAAKLLGAGGGGYLLMLAKDADAGAKIRQILSTAPPNSRARFVEFKLSETGLQVTRS